jgi:hypothetical protein
MWTLIAATITSVIVGLYWLAQLNDRYGFLRRVPNIIIWAIAVIPVLLVALAWFDLVPIVEVGKALAISVGLILLELLPRAGLLVKWCLATPTKYGIKAYFWETKVRVIPNPDSRTVYKNIITSQYESDETNREPGEYDI